MNRRHVAEPVRCEVVRNTAAVQEFVVERARQRRTCRPWVPKAKPALVRRIVAGPQTLCWLLLRRRAVIGDAERTHLFWCGGELAKFLAKRNSTCCANDCLWWAGALG